MRRLVVGVGFLAFVGAAGAQEPTYRSAERLPTPAKLERSGQEIDKMKGTLKQALERLKSARERKDILQVNCVNDKLSAIKGLLKISEEAQANLKEAARQEDEELVNHEFTKISIAGIRVENFRVEVEGCVGEASQYTGETVVDTYIDPNIRSDDPTEEPPETLPPVATERPEPVSGSE
ncbi:MAG: hypothetical protein KC549_00865 [Myxococcales bacterium]|nr:hypothetical protein [Myxococcales bacterium]MCB9547273.1 hypothetical protein [Myxococcales bacterium]